MFTNNQQPRGYKKGFDNKYIQGAHAKLSCEICKIIPRHEDKDKSKPIEFYVVLFKVLSGEYKDHIHSERYNLSQAWKMIYLAKACGTQCYGNELPVNFDAVSLEHFKVMISTVENPNRGKVYTNLGKVWISEEPANPAASPSTENPSSPVAATAPIQGFPLIKDMPSILAEKSALTPSSTPSNPTPVLHAVPQVKEHGPYESEEIF